MRVVGEQPRPRILLIGEWSEADEAELGAWARTIHRPPSRSLAFKYIPAAELDLVVLAADVREFDAALLETNLLMFCGDQTSRSKLRPCSITVPGPHEDSYLQLTRTNSGEFHLPAGLHPSLDRARRRLIDRKWLTRGRQGIEMHVSEFAARPRVRVEGTHAVPEVREEQAQGIVKAGTIVAARTGGAAVGLAYTHPRTKKGLAWLPNFPEPARWVRAVAESWAAQQPDAFPTLIHWDRDAAWQTRTERERAQELASFLKERRLKEEELDRREEELRASVDAARDQAVTGARRLLTTQGADLVDAVADAFRAMGFVVTDMDAETAPGKVKREDLRLTIAGEEWTALVEVRGYARGGAKATDLQRFLRFEGLYVKETGRPSDKKIYVCNGQFSLPPDSRERPFHADRETAAIFGESGGLVVDTRDLFVLLRDETDENAARRAIIESDAVLELECEED